MGWVFTNSFYFIPYTIDRPSWGLGSAMREIRHRSSRFAIARLFWRGREVHKRRRVVFQWGKEAEREVYIYSLSAVLCHYPDQFVYLNEGFKLQPPHNLFIRVLLLAFPNKKIAPLTARNRSQTFRSPQPGGVDWNGRITRVFCIGCCSHSPSRSIVEPSGIILL